MIRYRLGITLVKPQNKTETITQTKRKRNQHTNLRVTERRFLEYGQQGAQKTINDRVTQITQHLNKK